MLPAVILSILIANPIILSSIVLVAPQVAAAERNQYLSGNVRTMLGGANATSLVEPHSLPACTDINQLTNNTFPDRGPVIDGGQVVWEGYDGNDWEIFLHNGSSIIQLTDNTLHEYGPVIDGGQVVWYAYDGNDNEIFLHNGSSIIQLTDNTLNDYGPVISMGQVVWYASYGNDDQLFLYEIFLFDGASVIQLTDNTFYDVGPEIDGGQVVWHGWDGQDFEIFSASLGMCPEPFDFALAVSLASATVSHEASASATVNATLLSGIAQPVTFSAKDMPSGAVASFSPTECTPTCSAMMNITTSSTTPVGNYIVTITATDGVLVRNVTLKLTVVDNIRPTVSITKVTALADGFLPMINYTSFPAIVGYSPVLVFGTAYDNTGVVNVSAITTIGLQGGPVYLFGDGTWVAVIPLQIGFDTINITATDTSGNAASTTVALEYSSDLDGDGIDNNIDGYCLSSPPTSHFNESGPSFCDHLLGGKTSGQIVQLGADSFVRINSSSLQPSQGVNVAVNGPGEPFAVLKLDGSLGTITLSEGYYTLSDPEQTTQIKVIHGKAVGAFTVNGVAIQVELEAGETANITEAIQDGALVRLTVSSLQGTVAVNGIPVADGQTITLPLDVSVDIKPGSDSNPINVNSKGVIAVAILSSQDFDARTVDPNAVLFAGASAAHLLDEDGDGDIDWDDLADHVDDVNSDGLVDVVLHFRTQKTNLEEGDEEACLTGETFDGLPIKGCDSVRVFRNGKP